MRRGWIYPTSIKIVMVFKSIHPNWNGMSCVADIVNYEVIMDLVIFDSTLFH